MSDKKWGVINFDKGGVIDKKTAYPIEWCDTLQQSYSVVMRGYATGEINQAIVRIYQITDVEVKPKQE